MPVGTRLIASTRQLQRRPCQEGERPPERTSLLHDSETDQLGETSAKADVMESCLYGEAFPGYFVRVHISANDAVI